MYTHIEKKIIQEQTAEKTKVTSTHKEIYIYTDVQNLWTSPIMPIFKKFSSDNFHENNQKEVI